MCDACYDPAAATPGTAATVPTFQLLFGTVDPTIGAGTEGTQGVTFYSQSNGALWYKNGPGDFDWVLVVAAPV